MEREIEGEGLIRARRNGVRRTRRIWYLAFSTARKINIVEFFIEARNDVT